MLNVIPMVTIKRIVLEYTQEEIRKKFKHFILKKSTQKKSMQEMRSGAVIKK